MIQRIQSVYLLIAALLLLYVVFLADVGDMETAQRLAWYGSAITIVGIAAATIAIGSIFLYGNRAKQVKLVLAAQMTTLLFMIILYGGLFLSGEYTLLSGANRIGQIIALLLPVLAYLMLYSAKKAIRKDINLVKSMDRLR